MKTETPHSAASTNPALEIMVRRDLLLSHFQESLGPSIVLVAMCLLVAFVARNDVPPHVLALFMVIVTGVQLIRIGARRRFLQQAAMTPPDERFWGPLVTILSSAGGLSVGVGCIALHHYAGEWLMPFVFMTLTGLSSGAAGAGAFYPPSLRAYVLMSTPVFTAYYLIFCVESANQVIIAIAMAAHSIATLTIIGRNHSLTLRASVQLRYEKDDLLEQLHQQTLAAESARAQAESANEEKTRFFASASHDLRQPVHALNLYSTLLRDAREENRDELLTRINSCVGTLDNLFNALLTVSRAEALGHGISAQSAVSLDAAMDSVLKQLEPQAREKGLLLHHVPTSLWAQGDAIAVERILGNLVTNAIRFTAQGKVLVGVRRRGAMVELQVLDTGIGLSEDHKTRVFEEFYQVANPGRDAAQGFGLGLVIVRRLCRSFNYRIALHSIVGRGSRFSVTMPRATPPAAMEEVIDIESAEFSHHNARVLLVDDDAVVRDAMARTFVSWGLPADVVATDEQALTLAAAALKPWNCLLLDLRLGGEINGVELAQRLLQTLNQRVPIAILTGEADGPVLDEARALGYTILRKPVKMMRLRAFLLAAETQATALPSAEAVGVEA